MAEKTTNLVTIMSSFDIDILEKNRENIRKLLNVADVLDHLEEKRILMNKDCTILRQNKDKAPDLLVDLLLNNNTSSALLEFTKALEKAGGYDTLLFILGCELESDSKSDTDEEKDEDVRPQKREKYYRNKIKQKNNQIRILKEELAKEQEVKKTLQSYVNELVQRGGKKDKKIKELKSQLKEHECRIHDLEERLRKGFTDHDKEIDAINQRLDMLDTTKTVYVGNVGTTIQTHVHNPEESSDTAPAISTQPTGEKSYLNSRVQPHLCRTTLTPRTPRSARSKSKK